MPEKSKKSRLNTVANGDADLFEVAEFIAEKIAAGMLQKDVAALIGKSQAYVSNHLQLLTLPLLTDNLVRTLRLTDMTGIIDLAKLERLAPKKVASFLEENPVPSRAAIQRLRRQIATQPNTEAPKQAFPRWERGNVVVEHDGRWAVIVLEKKPRNTRHAWIRYADQREVEVPVTELTIRAIVAS